MAERILTVVKDFERLEECLNTSELDIFALNQFNAIISKRIFNDNLTVDDTRFGTYRSESYKKKREAAKLETGKKDLQFTRELRNDLDIGVYEGKNALGFSGQEREVGIKKKRKVTNGQIAEFQEGAKQIGKPIFAASQGEVDEVFKTIDEELDRIIAECLRI